MNLVEKEVLLVKMPNQHLHGRLNRIQVLKLSDRPSDRKCD